MKRLVAVLLLLAIGVLAGRFLWPGSGAASGSAAGVPASAGSGGNAEATVWTCSMHPQIRLPQPGRCPICGMDLIPAAAETGVSGPIVLGPGAQQVASIETARVERRVLEREVRTVGRIEAAEPLVAYLTARADGRVERVYADFTGVDVAKNDHLVDIYSPDLVVAQEEYLIAARNIETLRGSTQAAAGDTFVLQQKLARQKLQLLGVTGEQVEKLAETKEPQVVLTVFAPIGGTVMTKNVREQMYVKTGDPLYMIADLSTVWLFAEVYEYELPWVALGQETMVQVEGVPGETFRGTVAFIDPVVNDATRTVKVRVNIANPKRHLRPGMFARAVIRARIGPDGRRAPPSLPGRWTCRMHPEVWSDEPGTCSVCGMELVPRAPGGAAAPPPGAARWSCPHHPDLARDAPGTCPECGMALVEKAGGGGSLWTCPHHPELKEPAPGTCPDCGMALREAKAEPAAPRTIWTCPMHPEIRRDAPGDCPICKMSLVEKVERAGDGSEVLAIPAAAVLDTGTRHVVYVERSPGSYELAKVTLGPRAGDRYPVLSGLNEGDLVVVRGNFLLDSQSQIEGRPSLLFPKGLVGEPSPPAAGHEGHR